MDISERLAGRLLVSCQAREGEPLCGPHFMAAMAQSAELGGAAGIRVDGPDNIRAIRKATNLPIVGSYKILSPETEVRVTPTFAAAKAVREAGADIVGIDATFRPRGEGGEAGELIGRIKNELGLLVMADVAVLKEGYTAAEAGADFVTTALAGYTSYSPNLPGPDFKLLTSLVGEVDIPIVAEGRVGTPEEARRSLELGAFAVIVGSAITRPEDITRRFREEMELVKARARKKNNRA